jgi:hypothetical protein
MKKTVCFITLTICIQYATAQPALDNGQYIAAYVECLSQKSTAPMEHLLAPDFTMMGQKQPVALKVLQAIINQIVDEVINTDFVGEDKNGDDMVLRYQLSFATGKKRECTFHITAGGQISEIALEGVSAQVKQTSELSQLSDKDLPKKVEIPFTLINDIPCVKANINGVECNFLFDSGAPSIILNAAYYADTTKRDIAGQMKGVSGGISNLTLYNVEKFEFAGITSANMEVMCIPLAHLEQSGNMPVHGLIGYAAIKNFDVLYDYHKKVITLIREDYAPDFIDSLRISGKIAASVPVIQQAHIPCITAKINNTDYNLGIDSGAGSNLFDVDLFGELRKSVKGVKTVDLAGANANKEERQKGKIKKLEIGNKVFKNTTTVFSNISHLATIKINGLIGYPILSRQKCMVSYHTNSFILLK